MENDTKGIKGIADYDEFIKDFTNSDDGTVDYEGATKALHEAGRQWEGLSKRNFTDLEKLRKDPRLSEEKKPDNQPPPKKGFDLGEKAYLKSMDVDVEDFEYIQEAMEDSGKSLDSLLETKWFQNDLKERKESRATAMAMPKDTRRATSSARNTVDYWIQKNELPPREEWDLRKQVLAEKLKRAKNKNQFADDA